MLHHLGIKLVAQDNTAFGRSDAQEPQPENGESSGKKCSISVMKSLQKLSCVFRGDPLILPQTCVDEHPTTCWQLHGIHWQRHCQQPVSLLLVYRAHAFSKSQTGMAPLELPA